MESSGALSLEFLNDQSRQSPEVTQYLPDWFIGDQVSFVKGYVEGHLKLAIRRVNPGSRYYGAIPEARPRGNKFQSLFECHAGGPDFECHAGGPDSEGSDADFDQAL